MIHIQIATIIHVQMHLHIFMKCTLLFPLIFSPLKYIFWKTIYDQLVNHISVMSGAFTNETRHCAVCLPPGSAAQVCENTLNETIIALQRFCVHCILLGWHSNLWQSNNWRVWFLVNASLGRDMGDSKARAIQSWSQGTPVALGAGKKRRRENDVDSDEVLVS